MEAKMNQVDQTLESLRVMGNFFIVENPLFVGKETESGLVIPEMARKKKDDEESVREDYQKLTKLKVVKVGSDCTKAQVGNEVFINMNQVLSPARLTVEFGKKGYLIFRETDIIFFY